MPIVVNMGSVNARLDRAEDHFGTLKSEIFAYFHHRPYRYVERVSDDFTKYSIVSTRTACEPPLEKWALMTGDCLHNLRSALDNLIFAIAAGVHGYPVPHADDWAFPISEKPNSFPSFRGKFVNGTLPAEVWDSIKRFQPDARKHPELPPLLEILSTLNNEDKHRLLRLAVASPEQYDIGFDLALAEPKPFVGRYLEEAYYGELYDGVELFSLTFEVPTRNVKFDRVNLEMSFAIWHGAKKELPVKMPWNGRSNVLALLRVLIDEVKHAVREVSESAMRLP